jgi:hypothetical protein
LTTTGEGNFDRASADGTDTHAVAGAGNGDVATVFDPTGTVGSEAEAIYGNGDLASVVGDHSTAYAGGVLGLLGNDDVASVVDPTGTLGSTAVAGFNIGDTAAGSFDLASVSGDGLSSTTATGANFLTDLLSAL